MNQWKETINSKRQASVVITLLEAKDQIESPQKITKIKFTKPAIKLQRAFFTHNILWEWAKTETGRGDPCGTLINGQMARPLSQLFLSSVPVCKLQGSSVDVAEYTDSVKVYMSATFTQAYTHTHTGKHICWFLRTERKINERTEEFRHFTTSLANDSACFFFSVWVCVRAH